MSFRAYLKNPGQAHAFLDPHPSLLWKLCRQPAPLIGSFLTSEDTAPAGLHPSGACHYHTSLNLTVSMTVCRSSDLSYPEVELFSVYQQTDNDGIALPASATQGHENPTQMTSLVLIHVAELCGPTNLSQEDTAASTYRHENTRLF